MALACGATPHMAAVQGGVAKRTVIRWLGTEDCKREIREIRDVLSRQTLGQFIEAEGRVVPVLIEILEDKEQPAAARVSAGREIREGKHKNSEALDLADRVSALEKAFAAGGTGQRALPPPAPRENPQ
jgi:hypothetical protein